MAVAPASRWRRLRLFVRVCRIGLLLLVLVLVCVFVYLNVAGLPEPLNRALREELNARGLALEFETLRLNWNWAILAEQVRVRSARQGALPEVDLAELLVRINWSQAFRGRIEVTAISFREGRLAANLAPTNEPPEVVAMDGLGGALRFLPQDRWELDSFRGQFLGASLAAFGSITNAFKLPRVLAGDGQADTDALAGPGWAARLRRVARVWKQLKFIAPPEIRIRFGGDAAQPGSFTGDVRLTAAGVVSPWGESRSLDLALILNEEPTHDQSVSRGIITVAALQTRWGELENLRAEARLGRAPGATTPRWFELDLTGAELRRNDLSLRRVAATVRSEPSGESPGAWHTKLHLRTGQFEGQGITVGEVALDSSFAHGQGRWVPDAGQVGLALHQLEGQPGRIGALRISADFERSEPTAPEEARDVPMWLRAQKAKLNVALEALRAGELQVSSFATDANWESLRLTLTNTVAELPEATITFDSIAADLRSRDVAIRASARGRALATLLPWLRGPLRDHLTEITLQDPLLLTVDARARLPASLTREAFTSAEFRESVSGTAGLQVGHAAWRGIEIDSGELSASYGDGQAVLNKLSLQRPEGVLTVNGRLDLASLEYHGKVESSIPPQASAPALGRKGAAAFRVFEFRQAPVIRASFSGYGADLARLVATATVTCPDFAVRGQDLQRFSAAVVFTNLFVSARDLEVFHGEQRAAADGLGFDVRTHRLSLTNATSNLEPMVAATAIGTNVVKAISQYHFTQPPTAVVNGSLITKGKTNHADLRFELDGGPFEYWRFRVPRVNGTVEWREDTVTVTNLLADFYGGRLNLDLHANLIPGGQASIRFNAGFGDADLRKALTDLVPSATNLDGTVSGRLTVTQLLTDDWKSWQGHGEARLRNGYLWDLPLFAFLSEVVNGILPGAGKAKASAGACTFVITNSVLNTKDLRIEARPLRLAGRGTVDFDANVNMDVEAEVLPGIPLVGPLFNLAMLPVSKAFTYRVVGTLGNPRVLPLYMPKFLSTLLNLGRRPKSTNAVTTPRR